MDHPNSTTSHEKNTHLKYNHRVIIEMRLKDGHTAYKIAKELGCAANTVRNEIKKGTVDQLKQGRPVSIYYANAGQRVYDANRKNCIKKFKRLQVANFISHVTEMMQQDTKWSVDACVGEAIASRRYDRSEMVCSKTLYSYIDLGLMAIKNTDLPQKLRRNTKKARVRKNKRVLGRSIEERDKAIESREEFGHWEIDTVIGVKDKDDDVLLTLAERKTRHYITRKINNKGKDAVMEALTEIAQEYGDQFAEVFKTITGDNGQEFADLSSLELITNNNIKVYFTHPYSSFEKGTNERHNGLIRRFIPKGSPIADYTADDIAFIEDWCNMLPRKILGYKTPSELFEAELDAIYAA
jgi:IS30 family transposase